MTIRTILIAAALTGASNLPATASTIEFRYDPQETTNPEQLQDRIRKAAEDACNDSAMTPPASRIQCRRDIAHQLLGAIADRSALERNARRARNDFPTASASSNPRS